MMLDAMTAEGFAQLPYSPASPPSRLPYSPASPPTLPYSPVFGNMMKIWGLNLLNSHEGQEDDKKQGRS